jgi:hypothetical protein
VLLTLTVAIPAFGGDQQKTEKLLHQVTAMATNGTGRRVVSITVADTLGIKRFNLVMERRIMNLNYGDLFVAQALVKNGTKLEDISAQLKAKKNIIEIANDLHTDWKQLAADAKKLNAKVEDNLYKHFVNGKADGERDVADKYNVEFDSVAADRDVSQADIAKAEHMYEFWRDRATPKKDLRLDSLTERAAREARGDPIGKAPTSGSTPSPPQ